MIDTIYIEECAAELPETVKILKRFPRARKIEIDRYTELFNRKNQNFRLQKQHPALILARKESAHVLKAPLNYGIGGEQNFYFSHMMNCIYDCRYCFLQGMYQSANYVVFVNYHDYFDAIKQKQLDLGQQTGWFFSGYDCDSLALEPITRFVDASLDFFSELPDAILELRTKSTQIRPLLKRQAISNCVVAFSFSPEEIVQSLEHKTPSLKKRIQAIQELAQHGWPIGLRFDPVIYCKDYKELYGRMINEVFTALKPEQIHSVSLGPFRLPKSFLKKVTQLYPDEAMFAGEFSLIENNLQTYAPQIENEMMQYCEYTILQYIPRNKYFPCVEIAA